MLDQKGPHEHGVLFFSSPKGVDIATTGGAILRWSERTTATLQRVLDKAHQQRNLGEYEGQLDVDAALIEALIRVASEVESRVKALGPIK